MKKMKITKKVMLTAIIAMTVYACTDIPQSMKNLKLKLPEIPFDYSHVELDGERQNIKNQIMDKSREVFNDHTATLGRVLFYERALSVNNSVSCGSCHIQSKGFTDGLKHSVGFGGKTTPRNTPSVFNTFTGKSLFWDVRAKNSVDLSLEPVFNHLEMGIESDEMLLKKIKERTYYPELFKNAFGKEEITKEKVALALASFMNSIAGDDLMAFVMSEDYKKQYANNQMVNLGKDLYFSKRTQCASCHSVSSRSPVFGGGFPIDPGFFPDEDIFFGGGGFDGYMGSNAPVPGVSNIGLDFNYSDNGAGEGNFKIPNLMNVALTAPYMHDGRYNTLEEVIEHYNSGIRNHPKLDPKFVKNGKVVRLNLTKTEKDALVAFLRTLKNDKVLTDPKFSDPFVLD